jgi:hypothetical protein
MKYAVIAARVLMGLGFTIFGANIIHPFMPMPPMDPESLPMKFGAIMGPSHWMAVVGVVQLLGGLFTLSGVCTPIGLVMLGPVLVNILCFHICLEGGTGIAPGLVFTALELFLLYAYRGYFLPILTCKAEPTA